MSLPVSSGILADSFPKRRNFQPDFGSNSGGKWGQNYKKRYSQQTLRSDSYTVFTNPLDVVSLCAGLIWFQTWLEANYGLSTAEKRPLHIQI